MRDENGNPCPITDEIQAMIKDGLLETKRCPKTGELLVRMTEKGKEDYRHGTHWFRDALRRYMLRTLAVHAKKDPNQTFADREGEQVSLDEWEGRVRAAETAGALLDIEIYDFGLHNDISMLLDIMSIACEERDLR